MKGRRFWANRGTLVFVAGLLLVLAVAGWVGMGQEKFVRTALSGLTLGALYFMVAAGLTLIFGLMDVLNFAHGSMFMIGAYAGWQMYTNPTFLFGVAPLLCALIAGIAATGALRPWVVRWNVSERWQGSLRGVLTVAAAALGALGLLGLDLLGLAETAMVAGTVGTAPLAELSAQEPLAAFWYRPVLVLLAGGVLALALARPGDKTQTVRPLTWRGWAGLGALLLLAVIATLAREAGPLAVLQLDANWRFVLALVTGALVGAGLGMAVEASLIQPLYARPFYQVLVTLGLGFVLREMTQVLWDPVAYQMSRPPWFSQPGQSTSLLEWVSRNTVTVNILGVTFPSYRLFVILLGVVMLIALGIVMNYSRLGMIIRAGVQDREMVEALGINVRRVFSLVFALGVGLAALGGIGAAPFIPVNPNMGDAFQLQAFIVVVIGGMGSFGGAAIGALLLGLARAFGDFFALQYALSPAVSEASTVIIMAIVLLVRPAGLFGKKE